MLENLFGISTAFAEEAAAAEEATVNPVVSLLFTFAPMILIFVIFWFMMIRPQRKKEQTGQVNDQQHEGRLPHLHDRRNLRNHNRHPG